ncbi:MAG: sigma-54 dependent transcriptional regulator [bacterium]
MNFSKSILKPYNNFIKLNKDLFIVFKKNCEIVWVKDDSFSFCGYLPEELIAQKLSLIINPVFNKPLKKLLSQFLNTKETDHFNLKVKPGTTNYDIGRVAHWRLSSLESLKAIAVLYDLNKEYRLAHFKIHVYETETRIMDLYKDLILITDKKYRIIDFNEYAYKKLFKFSKKKLIGFPVENIIGHSAWETYRNYIEKTSISKNKPGRNSWTRFYSIDKNYKAGGDFIFEFPEFWKYYQGKLSYSQKGFYSYAVLRRKFPFKDNNIKIIMDIEVGSQPGAILFFGVNNNPYEAYIETTGYSVSLSDSRLWITRLNQEVLVIQLKKKIQNTAVLIEFSLCGSHIMVKLNHKKMISYYDPNPLDLSGEKYAGMAFSYPGKISRFDILQQVKTGQPEKITPNALEVRLIPFPDEIYRLQIYNNNYYGSTVSFLHFTPVSEIYRLRKENIKLNRKLSILTNPKPIGQSPAMQEIFKVVETISDSSANVLVLGETGTGKEEIAQWIHRTSRRKDKPFIKIDCAALPPNLLESELFGHEKGSFTGAYQLKRGRFELAEGGTIFLDEIACIGLPLQAKLLRVIQDRKFERVGGTKTHKINVRIIAAANIDLEKAIDEGSFRRDIYYRLVVFSIKLPPLNQRIEDIPLLAKHFINIYSERYHKDINDISPEAMHLMKSFHWPGNVRELKNVIEHAVIMSKESIINIEDLPSQFKMYDSSENMGLPALQDIPGYNKLSKRQEAILRYILQRSGRKVMVKELALETREKYRTLQYNLGVLAKKGILQRTGKASGVLYGLRNP